MTNQASNFSKWIGRTETVEDGLSSSTAASAAATFDDTNADFGTGTPLPPLWHWFYFLTKASQSKLGEDGHPQRDEKGFMPPILLPRRMFAGARLRWHQPLVCGEPARREAVIRDVVEKSGRSGPLAFVTVGCSFYQRNELCIEEEQDIVYREPGLPLPAPEPVELPAVPDGAWSRTVTPNTRLLFRFSALTFNAHRIHYDRPYALKNEGYPGLVVHGPLTAMLLLTLVRQNTSQSIGAFGFRSRAPLFDLAPFRLVGIPSESSVELEAQGPDGKTAMTATADLT